jgi:hypothetical protein
MICCAPTHPCHKRNGRVWNPRSISMPRGILTLTLYRSTWRRPAVHSRCSPHTLFVLNSPDYSRITGQLKLIETASRCTEEIERR